MPYILRIGDELVQLLIQHYDRFDSRYNGSHSLRRVYVPEVLEDIEE
jgi:restriction system protein